MKSGSLEIHGDPATGALYLYAPPPGSVTSEGGLRRLLRTVLYVLLPAPCLACGEATAEPRRSLGLCAPCRGRLERWPLDACDACGRPVDGARGAEAEARRRLPAAHRCDDCRRRPLPYERLLSAWSYRPPLDAVLAGLKFRRLEYLGAQLGRRVAELLRPEVAGCDLVVPVPLHWRRYLRRGYNQAAAIARPMAAEIALPVAGVLRRRRATPAQSRLSRAERARNLRAAFSVKIGCSCAGAHVLLVDDVVTTGTTLQTAADCLRRAGAASVTALTVARTARPA